MVSPFETRANYVRIPGSAKKYRNLTTGQTVSYRRYLGLPRPDSEQFTRNLLQSYGRRFLPKVKRITTLRKYYRYMLAYQYNKSRGLDTSERAINRTMRTQEFRQMASEIFSGEPQRVGDALSHLYNGRISPYEMFQSLGELVQ